MKVDVNTGVPPAPCAAPATGPERGERWLAQLELAYLGTLHGDAPPPPRREGAQAPDAAPSLPRAGGPGPDVDIAGRPSTAAAPGAAWSAISVGRAVLVPASPVPPPGGAYADIGRAATHMNPPAIDGGGTACATTPAGGGSPGFKAAGRGAAPEPGSSARFATSAPRYAKQFMQLSLADPSQAQASVRDASLSAASAAAVARGVASQLQSEGVTIQRVFVNGRRFDTDASRPAAVEPPVFKNQTQE